MSKPIICPVFSESDDDEEEMHPRICRGDKCNWWDAQAMMCSSWKPVGQELQSPRATRLLPRSYPVGPVSRRVSRRTDSYQNQKRR